MGERGEWGWNTEDRVTHQRQDAKELQRVSVTHFSSQCWEGRGNRIANSCPAWVTQGPKQHKGGGEACTKHGRNRDARLGLT